MNSIRIPITADFNNGDGGSPVGWAEFRKEAKAKLTEGMVFAPGFYQHTDGTLELIEISLVPAARAKDGPYIHKEVDNGR